MCALKRVREESVERPESYGLSDGGHVYLDCSNCRARLVDIWVTRPHLTNLVARFKARCPFCQDWSFEQEVVGGFVYGGYGRMREGDEDVDVPSTVVPYFDVEDDVFVFHVMKASADARPVRCG